MDYQALSSFHFWKYLDDALVRDKYSGERRESLYPSESSCVYVDPKTKKARIIGGCLRKSWYRLLKFKQSNPASTKSQYIFEFGRMVENFITDLTKVAKVYDNNSVKFWDRSSSVSGEIDITVKHPDNNKYIFIECKSTYGGMMRNGYEAGKARDLFDHYKGAGRNRVFVKGKPKYEHVLQLATYLYTHKEDPDLLGGKLVYFLRDNCSRSEHDVHLVEESGKYRVAINGEIDKGFFVEDIYTRYAELAEKVNQDIKMMREGVAKEQLTPPDRDYTIEYSADEIEERVADGRISARMYKSWQDGKSFPSDWQCSYCSFKDLCWGNRAKQQSEEDEED